MYKFNQTQQYLKQWLQAFGLRFRSANENDLANIERLSNSAFSHLRRCLNDKESRYHYQAEYYQNLVYGNMSISLVENHSGDLQSYTYCHLNKNNGIHLKEIAAKSKFTTDRIACAGTYLLAMELYTAALAGRRTLSLIVPFELAKSNNNPVKYYSKLDLKSVPFYGCTSLGLPKRPQDIWMEGEIINVLNASIRLLQKYYT